jgi:hypothetical protein
MVLVESTIAAWKQDAPAKDRDHRTYEEMQKAEAISQGSPP